MVRRMRPDSASGKRSRVKRERIIQQVKQLARGDDANPAARADLAQAAVAGDQDIRLALDRGGDHKIVFQIVGDAKDRIGRRDEVCFPGQQSQVALVVRQG